MCNIFENPVIDDKYNVESYNNSENMCFVDPQQTRQKGLFSLILHNVIARKVIPLN